MSSYRREVARAIEGAGCDTGPLNNEGLKVD
jgi:hypothetical protein